MNAAYLLLAVLVLLAVWRFPAWRPRHLPGVSAPPPRALGHRGTRGVRRENTLPALTLALEQLDGLETDVWRTRDGALVLWHDPTCRGLDVRRSTLAELRAAEPDLATLDALLNVAAEHAGKLVNLELKRPGGFLGGWSLERGVARAVRRVGIADRTIVSSFRPLALARMRLAAPALRTALLYEATSSRPWLAWEAAAWLHVDALHPEEGLVDAALLRRAHDRGLAVNVWTVNDEARVRELARLGVDGIIADDPFALRRARDEGVADAGKEAHGPQP